MPVPLWVGAAASAALAEAASGAGAAAADKLLEAAGKGICNAHANNPSVIGSLGSFAKSFMDGACGPYYDDNGITPPFYGYPFSGGQCPKEYQVRILFISSSGIETGYIGDLIGPIGPIYVEVTPNGSIRTYVTGRLTPSGPFQEVTGGPYSWDGRSQPTVTIIPYDGDDDCGDPPNGDYPSPNAPPTNWGDTETVCIATGACFPITFNEPIIDVDGNLSIPVTIDDVTFDFGPKPAADGGGGPSSPPPATGGNPIEDPEEPGEVCIPQVAGKQCIGIFWTLVNTGETPVALPGSGGSAVYPRTIGNIRLRYGACGAGPLGDQTEIRCAQGTIFRGSENVNVAGFLVNHLPQFEGTYVPLYVEIEEDN